MESFIDSCIKTSHRFSHGHDICWEETERKGTGRTDEVLSQGARKEINNREIGLGQISLRQQKEEQKELPDSL